MRATLSNYWVIAMTLFALVGQGVLTNDSFMVPMAHAKMVQQTAPLNMLANHDLDGDKLAHDTMSAQTQGLTSSTTATPHQAMKNCHDNMPIANDVDQPITASLAQTSCCSGSGSCSLDCNHCLTISFTANLIDIQLALTKVPVNATQITMLVNHVSIVSPPAFRPPIA